jgi:hypothetical protein
VPVNYYATVGSKYSDGFYVRQTSYHMVGGILQFPDASVVEVISKDIRQSIPQELASLFHVVVKVNPLTPDIQHRDDRHQYGDQKH